MNRNRLKYGGSNRKKAIFGSIINAGASLAATAAQTAAILQAAKIQATAMKENAKTQSQAMLKQNENNNNLQRQSISFTTEQNKENRQQQQDIQMTLQMLAGQQNMNDINEARKAQVKYGGRPKRRNLKSAPFYGGANIPFTVTDGGGVVPLEVDNNGFGLYELYGNDHEHYHKTKSGKHKTGVGIKFANGEVVEGEGNQNTNKGELLYVTPNDAMFISKHSIDGFNPRAAVEQGLNPEDAFNIQEELKAINGYKDDGTKAKCGKHKSIKRLYGGYNILFNNANLTQNPSNLTLPVATGAAYLINNKNAEAKLGRRISFKCGGRHKAVFGINGINRFYNDYISNSWLYGPNNSSNNSSNSSTNTSTGDFNDINNSDFWNNYGGAIMSAGANLLGGTMNFIGSSIAGNMMANAANEAAEINADAARRLKTIDPSILKDEDYKAAHAIAAIRLADTNVNPQLERIRRDAAAETKQINRGTLSSAARQQYLAGTNDRARQRVSEVMQYKHNADEAIKQENAKTITNTSQINAQLDTQARQNFTRDRLALAQYNNNIENQRTTGEANAYASGTTLAGQAKAMGLQSGLGSLGNALGAAGNAFSTAYDAKQKYDRDLFNAYLGLGDDSQVRAALYLRNKDLIKGAWAMNQGSDDASIANRNMIKEWAKRNNFKLS
jgi:hypothetical protein